MPKVKDPAREAVFQRLMFWIAERESIRRKKEAGEPRPWTDDEILHKWRFCNVHREDDKVTKWIAKHWRGPHRDDPDLFFAMVIARMFNLPTTLAYIEYPVPWKMDHVTNVIRRLKRGKKQILNGAYVVSTNGNAMDKFDYIVQRVLDPIWKHREWLRPTLDDNLIDFHDRLIKMDGMGHFMSAQVIADMKYAPVLVDADDWETFAASGPGSRRGLNRIELRDHTKRWNEQEWRSKLNDLREKVNEALKPDKLHAQDLQNCLCEFDKYERALHNQGLPKQKYTPNRHG